MDNKIFLLALASFGLLEAAAQEKTNVAEILSSRKTSSLDDRKQARIIPENRQAQPVRLRREFDIDEFPQLSQVPGIQDELERLQDTPGEIEPAKYLNNIFFIINLLFRSDPEGWKPLLREFSRFMDLFILTKEARSSLIRRIEGLEG